MTAAWIAMAAVPLGCVAFFGYITLAKIYSFDSNSTDAVPVEGQLADAMLGVYIVGCICGMCPACRTAHRISCCTLLHRVPCGWQCWL